jgi:lysophospholipase L1-like esterase
MKNALMITALTAILISALQAEDIKIACIGNSITNESIYPAVSSYSYPTLLNILLGEGYQVGNFGCSGRTMLKKGDYPIWNEQALPAALAFQPDIVTIMLGTNDSKPYNWIYKDEFKQDYCAMIDTFQSLESHPAIYVCLPLVSFTDIYNISDSVIVNDIIPIIQEIAQEKNIPAIDFHTFFTGKREWSYDGIHPNGDGAWEIAKLFYATLTGSTVQEITDINLALNKTVLVVPQSAENPANLVDSDVNTKYTCSSGDAVIIDLGAAESVDMFQIIFNEIARYGYKIETSPDNAVWAVAADSSGKIAPAQVAVTGIEPVEIQFIRFTFNNLYDTGSVPIAELKVLKTAVVHGPVIISKFNRQTTKQVRYDLTFFSSIPGGYMKYYSAENLEGPWASPSAYRLVDEMPLPVYIQIGKNKYYVAKYYKGGYEVASDTLGIVTTTTGIEERKTSGPSRFMLCQNFPNPFNPVTQIRYSVPESGPVSLTVSNVLGETIATLFDGFQEAGDHRATFDGNGLSDGVYFYRLQAGPVTISKKCLLMK